MEIGGIVLCGGKSSRMGRAKAWLPFGDEFMLQRVVRILREATGTVVVVAAPDQDLPSLSADVEIVRDEIEGRGPLGGLAAGLAARAHQCEAVYLSACDAPFLKPEIIRRVVGCLETPEGNPPPNPLPEGRGSQEPSESDCEPGAQNATRGVLPLPAGRGLGGGSSLPLPEGKGPGGRFPSTAVPSVGGFLHPLAAAYRGEVLTTVRAMLAGNDFRMTNLFTRVPTRLIGPEELRDTDPELGSLRNLNTPDEYAAALRELGNANGARPAS